MSSRVFTYSSQSPNIQIHGFITAESQKKPWRLISSSTQSSSMFNDVFLSFRFESTLRLFPVEFIPGAWCWAHIIKEAMESAFMMLTLWILAKTRTLKTSDFSVSFSSCQQSLRLMRLTTSLTGPNTYSRTSTKRHKFTFLPAKWPSITHGSMRRLP
ncbi:hypothetical protein Hdeb2414_s0025g00662991 [Helianthus debilis subsp. tardiflorus]